MLTHVVISKTAIKKAIKKSFNIEFVINWYT